VHGHNFDVEVCVGRNDLNEIGMVEDFTLLKMTLNDILEGLDHQLLNEIPPFDKCNPTSEMIAYYLFEELEKRLSSIKVFYVDVAEGRNSLARYEK